jgi:hypothetical protein
VWCFYRLPAGIARRTTSRLRADFRPTQPGNSIPRRAMWQRRAEHNNRNSLLSKEGSCALTPSHPRAKRSRSPGTGSEACQGVWVLRICKGGQVSASVQSNAVSAAPRRTPGPAPRMNPVGPILSRTHARTHARTQPFSRRSFSLSSAQLCSVGGCFRSWAGERLHTNAALQSLQFLLVRPSRLHQMCRSNNE